MSLRVGILEDDTFTRASLTAAVQKQGLEVSISASSAREFLSMARVAEMDVALLDLHLGEGPSGLDVANQLRKENKEMGIVILTSFEDPRLLSSGAGHIPSGTRYLVKRQVEDFSVLEKEIRLAFEQPKSPLSGYVSPLEKLSDGQVETLRLIAEGYSNSEIAKMRFVSEKTVESTITKIVRELGLQTISGRNPRMQMARAYFRARGVSVSEG